MGVPREKQQGARHKQRTYTWRQAPAPRAVAAPEKLQADAETATPLAGGTLHVLSTPPLVLSTRTERRVLRVWTPPGWTADTAPPGGWPVRGESGAVRRFWGNVLLGWPR